MEEFESGVDDAGMFVVIKLRDDIEKAREVANEIRKGALRGFSIGGQAFKRMNKSDDQRRIIQRFPSWNYMRLLFVKKV